jgi:hypothetical protein
MASLNLHEWSAHQTRVSYCLKVWPARSMQSCCTSRTELRLNTQRIRKSSVLFQTDQVKFDAPVAGVAPELHSEVLLQVLADACHIYHCRGEALATRTIKGSKTAVYGRYYCTNQIWTLAWLEPWTHNSVSQSRIRRRSCWTLSIGVHLCSNRPAVQLVVPNTRRKQGAQSQCPATLGAAVGPHSCPCHPRCWWT